MGEGLGAEIEADEGRNCRLRIGRSGVFEWNVDDIEVEIEKVDVEMEIVNGDVSEDLEDGTRAGVM